MKIFEDMAEFGGTIQDAIKQIIVNVFDTELDDDQVKEITNKLGLSDLLALDVAYTANDKAEIRKIIGPLPQLDEYSMGGGSQDSQAANRPQAAKREAPKAGGNADATPTGADNPRYSGDDDKKDDEPDQVVVKVNDEDEDEEELNETNIVQMKAWIQRRAGIR